MILGEGLPFSGHGLIVIMKLIILLDWWVAVTIQSTRLKDKLVTLFFLVCVYMYASPGTTT